jgi:transposase
MRKEGYSNKAIATNLGLSQTATQLRINKLIRDGDLEKRNANTYGRTNISETRETIPCLRCRQPFLSEDRRRIRFCPKCKRTTEWQTGVDMSGSFSIE